MNLGGAFKTALKTKRYLFNPLLEEYPRVGIQIRGMERRRKNRLIHPRGEIGGLFSGRITTIKNDGRCSCQESFAYLSKDFEINLSSAATLALLRYSIFHKGYIYTCNHGILPIKLLFQVVREQLK